MAYDTSLTLAHLAHHCPHARYIGPAHLAFHRFRITSRGHATIVPCSSASSTVEGVCYLLTASDQRRLDIHEGVERGGFEKRVVSVELLVAAGGLGGRDVVEILEKGLMPRGDEEKEKKKEKTREKKRNRRRETGEMTKAVVYVSRRRERDEPPREKNVLRIQNGINDAMALGVSSRYVQEHILSSLKRRIEKDRREGGGQKPHRRTTSLQTQPPSPRKSTQSRLPRHVRFTSAPPSSIPPLKRDAKEVRVTPERWWSSSRKRQKEKDDDMGMVFESNPSMVGMAMRDAAPAGPRLIMTRGCMVRPDRESERKRTRSWWQFRW